MTCDVQPGVCATDDLVREDDLNELLDRAFREDLQEAGDITSDALIQADRRGRAAIVARREGVIAGVSLIPLMTHPLIAELARSATLVCADGSQCQPGDVLATLNGPLRSILMVERVLLNLLTHLSGIATLTRQYVNAVSGTGATICDTRKTTPGMRRVEKYAVRCGGGTSHRLGLFDAMLIKDNHIAHIRDDGLIEALAAAIRRVRSAGDVTFVEVEVDTLEQFAHVLGMGSGLVDYVLLDNMSCADLTAAVEMRDCAESPIKLEASGGVTLDTVRAIAETGVERISVGALTHSAPILDLGLDVAGA